jgi:hypothetical protein
MSTRDKTDEDDVATEPELPEGTEILDDPDLDDMPSNDEPEEPSADDKAKFDKQVADEVQHGHPAYGTTVGDPGPVRPKTAGKSKVVAMRWFVDTDTGMVHLKDKHGRSHEADNLDAATNLVEVPNRRGIAKVLREDQNPQFCKRCFLDEDDEPAEG